MTLNELVAYFEKYYGYKYTLVMRESLLDYLNGYSNDFYAAVRKVVVLRFSYTFGKAPDIAIIEKNLDEIWAEVEKMRVHEFLPEPEKEFATPEETEEFISQMQIKFKNSKLLKTFTDNFENKAMARGKA